MVKDLITFFKNTPLEEVTSKLKEYNVKFVENEMNKYDNFLESKKNFSLIKEI